MKNIIIVGSSGHAKVVIDIVEQQCVYKIAGLLDKYRKPGETTFGYKVLGEESDLSRLVESLKLEGIIIAIGDNFTRSKVVEYIKGVLPDLEFICAIHPRSYIGRNVKIGEGTVIMAGVVVNPCCTIGKFSILNTNSSLEHDSVLREFTSLAPNASIGGGCQIGNYSAVSMGAVLIQRIEIGDHTVIGAGSTVVSNIGSYFIAYGSPAKVVRDRKPGDRYL